jgi:hypothetical protein
MKTRVLFGWLFFLMLALSVHAQQIKCDICGKVITSEYFRLVDLVTGKTNNVCSECEKLPKCATCGLPILGENTKLQDGRFLCPRDAAMAVVSDDEAKDVARSARDDVDRLFSRFISFPSDDVEVSIVDKFHLQNLMFRPGYSRVCASIFGVTASNPLGDGKYLHTIDLLSCMSRTQLMAVTAHEYTHAWMGENVSQGRAAGMDRDTLEAFCELIAYKYMASRQESDEMAFIRRNRYTEGKIDVLIAADEQYGFDAVVEWVKSGEDETLDLGNLDRIRAVNGTSYTRQPSPAILWSPVAVAAPTPVPDTLQLKGISGTADHPFAMINDTTFETLEQEKVRMGQTNVVVRCLQISTNSVVIQVNGSPKTQQLFLRNVQ